MAEEKKNTSAERGAEPGAKPGNEFDRRAFFVKLGLGSLSIAAVGTAAFSYQFLSPDVLYEPSPIVKAGKLCGGFGDDGRELRNLSHPCARRFFCAECRLYPPRLSDRMET